MIDANPSTPSPRAQGAGAGLSAGAVQESGLNRRGQYTATVAASVPLCRDHFRLVLSIADFPASRPGQFVQLACRDLKADYSSEEDVAWSEDRPPALHGVELAGPLAMLRRPFSLAGRRDTARGVELDIIHRRVGVGTDWLSRLKVGDALSVIGPLGNGFELPPENGLAVMVGGGVGIPPMIYLASALGSHGRRGVAFCGAVKSDLLPLQLSTGIPANADPGEPLMRAGEFAALDVPTVLCTDDGSYGFRGYVTEALERYLDRHLADLSQRQLAVVYTCGPEPMMKRVAQIADDRGIRCQVAVERAMACGMGTCQSCVIKVKQPAPEGQRPWVFKLACTDGPVFRGDQLLW